MTNIDVPAGGAGGSTDAPTAAPTAADIAATLPARLRVHALAKLLSVSSREVMAVLTDLGEAVRTAQSSIDRETAVRVTQALLPEPAERASTTQVEDPGAPAVPLAPMFNPPAAVFLSPAPAPTPARTPAAAPAADETAGTGEASDTDDDSDDTDDSGARRRRRRGRRGRGRGKGGEATEDDTEGEDGTEAVTPGAADAGGEDSDESDSDSDSDSGSESDDGDAAAKRRRRRRRRKSGGDGETGREDDPPNTVVHVRETRETRERPAEDRVQSVRGSTRLEAKRQRRRDGREAGRRRAPILSESEFLTRREAVDRTMVVRDDGDRTQIAVLEDSVLAEHFVTSSGSGSMVGNVYLGRVQNVLPSMEAAFVDIGRGRNAVLYAGEVDWDAAGLEGKARRIEQALSSGDSVLVQVTKEPVGHKGARLTTQISLPGRFLVYVPGGRATGISRKLPDTERKRLKDVLKRIVPDEAGVIIRTASEGTSEEELARDVRRLQAQWDVIQGKTAGKTKAPELLYEEPDLLLKVVRDLFTEDFSQLVVQGGDSWDTVEGYVSHVASELMPRVRKHTGTRDVFTEFRIDEQIMKALDRKVWLPSGGYLILDRTEAMTVIDVNTGKYTGSGGNLEETVTRNNLEAAEEIIRQLRLRDIGGIIVIDFIDMVLESNRDLVLRRLTECLGRDRTRHQVAEVTSLGLVQMTRKKVGTGLLEAFSQPCEHCKGRGVLVSTDVVPATNGNQAAAAAVPATAPSPSPASGRRSRSRREGDRTEAAQADLRPAEEQEPAVEPPAQEPAATAEPEPAAAEPASTTPTRGRRRATRTGPVTTGAPAAVETPALDAAEPEPTAPGAPEQPAPTVRTTTTTTRRRRAVSRPAGPPAVAPGAGPDGGEETRSEPDGGGGPGTAVPQAG